MPVIRTTMKHCFYLTGIDIVVKVWYNAFQCSRSSGAEISLCERARCNVKATQKTSKSKSKPKPLAVDVVSPDAGQNRSALPDYAVFAAEAVGIAGKLSRDVERVYETTSAFSQADVARLYTLNSVLTTLGQAVDAAKRAMAAGIERGAVVEPGEYRASVNITQRCVVAWKEEALRVAAALSKAVGEPRFDPDRYVLGVQAACPKTTLRTLVLLAGTEAKR